MSKLKNPPRAAAPIPLQSLPPSAKPTSAPPQMTQAELNVLTSFRALNQFGRGMISDFAAGLVLDFPAPVLRPALRLIRSGGVQ